MQSELNGTPFMLKHAVITGDIVGSRRIENQQMMMQTLKETLHELKGQYGGSYEVFRGDSFQIEVPNAANGATVAIATRANLIAKSQDSGKLWDARVAVGVGNQGKAKKTLAESNSEAFILSGLALDEAKHDGERLKIETNYPPINEELNLLTKFVDNIVERWTQKSAQVTWYFLTYSLTQEQIAKKVGIHQSSVSVRAKVADYRLVDEFISRYKKLLNEAAINNG